VHFFSDNFETPEREPSYVRSKEYELFLKWTVSEPFTEKGNSISALSREKGMAGDIIHRWLNHPLPPKKNLSKEANEMAKLRRILFEAG
jgi:hypothetical protein